MSGPITRPLDNEAGASPSYPRPYSASVGTDQSQNPGAGGSANRQELNFFGGKRDLILGVLLGIVIIQGCFLFFQWRNKEVASDLATYNAQEARIQQEINGRLLAILNCKR